MTGVFLFLAQQHVTFFEGYYQLNKNVVDKSYFVDISENLAFVIQCIFVGYTMNENRGEENNNICCSYLGYCLLSPQN